ncbi:MAG: 50S ribosomal protein L13 [Aquificae bacterium]|jgi:large subunit ribosomal protein L13|nr:50S ribosomal protein L13 [Aquificota bacterium]
MKTYRIKPYEVKREWYVVDATGKTLGRLASEIAKILMGKHKVYWSPDQDVGDFVIVVNADKVAVTGKKLKQKLYRWHTGYPGGFRERTLEWMLQHHPERVIKLAVKRMLPKNKLGHRMMKRLKVYAGPEHPHQAQQPKPLDLKA